MALLVAPNISWGSVNRPRFPPDFHANVALQSMCSILHVNGVPGTDPGWIRLCGGHRNLMTTKEFLERAENRDGSYHFGSASALSPCNEEAAPLERSFRLFDFSPVVSSPETTPN